MARALANGSTYRAESEPIEVTSNLPRLDPRWRFTDASGHDHDSALALVHRVQDDPSEPAFYFDADGEEYNAPSHLECRLCGETIVPSMVGPSGFREFIPGMVRYFRDDEEITEAEFTAAAASRQAEATATNPTEDLLRRYIWHIMDCESVNYISDARYAVAGRGGSSVEFTADEIATLERLAASYP